MLLGADPGAMSLDADFSSTIQLPSKLFTAR